MFDTISDSELIFLGFEYLGDDLVPTLMTKYPYFEQDVSSSYRGLPTKYLFETYEDYDILLNSIGLDMRRVLEEILLDYIEIDNASLTLEERNA